MTDDPMSDDPMSAGHIDRSAWPLVAVDARTLEPAAARRLVLDALTDALAREQAFTVVATLPPPPRRTRPQEALAAVRAIRALRPELARHCRGLAFVSHPDDDRPARPAAADRFWGCPTHTTTSPDEARQWASARFTDPGR